MEDLQNLKYKELQKLAKAAGIKANSPKAELVNALIAFNNESENEDDTDKKPEDLSLKPENLGEKLDVVVQNKMNETFEKETSVLNVTFDKEDELNDSNQTQDQSAEEGLGSRFVEFMDDGKDEVSFRRSSRRSLEKRTSTPLSVVKSQTPSRDYLTKKNKTPLRQVVKTPGSIQKKSDSNIPRFMKYATKTKFGSVRKVPNFAKIHAKNSEKLDSLDDYVERKKKLTDTVKKQLDQARAVAEEHNSIVNKVKSKFVPAVTSTAKMNLNFGNTSSSKKQEPFKFDSKPVAAAPKVAPKERKDIKASRTKAKPETKKPVRRESDPKPLLNITNTNKSIAMEKSINTTRTPGKGKFDLKASLAKGLSYQPHKGKVKPLERKKEKSAPVLAAASQKETKARQMEVIKGVRLNKRAELMMMKRKMSS